jgi:hypothetical protein
VAAGAEICETESAMNDEYRSLLLDAYKGELFGEALFGAYSGREDDPNRGEKLRTLERIEADTAARLRPLVDAAGIEIDATDIGGAQEQGRELGSAPGLDWDGFVKGLHDALPSFLASFVRLRMLAPEPGDAALVALINHEQAINAFSELELAGAADRSLAVLQWHLESVE